MSTGWRNQLNISCQHHNLFRAVPNNLFESLISFREAFNNLDIKLPDKTDNGIDEAWSRKSHPLHRLKVFTASIIISTKLSTTYIYR